MLIGLLVAALLLTLCVAAALRVRVTDLSKDNAALEKWIDKIRTERNQAWEDGHDLAAKLNEAQKQREIASVKHGTLLEEYKRLARDHAQRKITLQAFMDENKRLTAVARERGNVIREMQRQRSARAKGTKKTAKKKSS